ncbi:hypothetical protein LZ32DRAFT_164579 [Colletotrichum eremochloae]|nr:hypothetical protein LZ32DRAFT_164579 [Colletotrichum eremochloae]
MPTWPRRHMHLNARLPGYPITEAECSRFWTSPPQAVHFGALCLGRLLVLAILFVPPILLSLLDAVWGGVP